MAGLKELWGLSDKRQPDRQLDAKTAVLRAEFQTVIGSINRSLQFTAANARQSDHAPLAKRRDAVYVVFQRAMEQSAKQDQALGAASNLQVDVERLKAQTKQAKLRFESFLPSVEATEETLVTASDKSPRDAEAIRDQLEQAERLARERDYQAAIKRYKLAEMQANKLQQAANPAQANEKKYPLLGPVARNPIVPEQFDDLENWQNPLINGDPKELFTPERMDEVVGMHFDGEGNIELNKAMEGLVFPQPGEDPKQHLATIARLRGLDQQQVEDQYARFQQLQAISREMEKTRGLPHDDTYDNNGDDFKNKHPDFLGSRSNLRFGQVVGEATGLDPVFAGMLNPTGGMVGPGMNHLAPTDADSPVVWHGIFHDAGGYLLNHQNAGPGYSYLPHVKPESGRRGTDPFQGQVEGVSYWYEKQNPDGAIVEIFLKDLLASDKERSAHDAYLKDPVDDAEQFAKDLTQDAVDNVADVANEARNVNRATANELKQATHSVANSVNSALDVADQAADGFADKARKLGLDAETVDAAQQSIDEQLDAVREQVAEWDQNITGGIDRASEYVGKSIDDVQRWSEAAGAAVNDRSTEIADDTREAIHNKLVELGNDKELLDFARRGVDKYGETMEDARALKREVAARIDSAQATVAQTFDEAKAKVQEKLAVGAAVIDDALESAASARDYLIDKLDRVRETASRGADFVADKIDDAGDKIVETGRDIRDAAGSVVDGMADAVESTSDSIANTVDAASDSAGEKLGTLTTLFG